MAWSLSICWFSDQLLRSTQSSWQTQRTKSLNQLANNNKYSECFFSFMSLSVWTSTAHTIAYKYNEGTCTGYSTGLCFGPMQKFTSALGVLCHEQSTAPIGSVDRLVPTGPTAGKGICFACIDPRNVKVVVCLFFYLFKAPPHPFIWCVT